MKVVILAGGFGTRLAEETNIKPKPMVLISNLPILVHIINYYKKFNYNEFIICCGYKANIINDYFEKDYELQDKIINKIDKDSTIIKSKSEKTIINVVDTGLTTGTGGRIKKVFKYINEKQFMMTYGDGLSNVDINKLINHHNHNKRLVTLTAVHPPPRWGSLIIEGEQIIDIHEKFSSQGDRVNGGFFVISSEALKYITSDNIHWEQEPLKKLAKSNDLSAYKHDGFWQPMDTLREKSYLEELYLLNKAPWI
jgi:glucose-1-phosphate cytidylyltransferase